MGKHAVLFHKANHLSTGFIHRRKISIHGNRFLHLVFFKKHLVFFHVANHLAAGSLGGIHVVGGGELLKSDKHSSRIIIYEDKFGPRRAILT